MVRMRSNVCLTPPFRPALIMLARKCMLELRPSIIRCTTARMTPPIPALIIANMSLGLGRRLWLMRLPKVLRPYWAPLNNHLASHRLSKLAPPFRKARAAPTTRPFKAFTIARPICATLLLRTIGGKNRHRSLSCAVFHGLGSGAAG